MAMDEWLMGKGEFVRFYGWEKPTLSYGRNQRIERLNLDYCKENNFNYVRRPSGGRAVFHEFELTYSFISFRKRFPESIYESYKMISFPILRALKKVGVDAEFYRVKKSRSFHTTSCFDAPNLYEIGVKGRKIVGSAQWRKKDAILQHGSILFSWNKEHWAKSHSKENSKEVLKVLEDSMVTLSDVGINIGVKEFADILKKEFSICFSNDFENEDYINKKDEDFFKLLEKYKSDDWNLIK
jgi:lipoate-protein ligase A